MSNRYKGGIISATPPTTTGGETGVASGAWTLEQQLQAQAAGLWPLQPVPVYIEDVFSTWLYTGNGATQTINNGINLSGKGGLVWIKQRNGTFDHSVFDTVRGATNKLITNSTFPSGVASTSLTAFTSSGFTLGSDNDVNTTPPSNSFVSWTFREQPKFFDVVTYTGTGTTMTVPHNLGAVPGCMIVKGLNAASAWDVYHQSLGPTQVMRLSTTAAASGQPQWDNTAPTSTVFTVKGGETTNVSGRTYVAYLFAHNAGGFGMTGTDNVISCGSFTTDGSGNATVNLGYEPQWVMIKASSTTGSWIMNDNMRGMPATSNAAQLFANLSNAENTNVNGTRTNATGFNAVSVGADTTFIYIAIRRGPMNTPTTGTSVFSPNTQTGAGTSAGQTITTNFPVDLEISSGRSDNSGGNAFVDRLRGGQNYIQATNTNAEVNFTSWTPLIGFANNTGITDANYGSTSASYVAWNFRRAPGFFDEVCYTGDATTPRTINHNLGVAPELIITKQRDTARSWPVRITALGNSVRAFLNLTDAAAASASAFPVATYTGSTYVIGSDASVNASGGTYVAYLFATVAGVSKVGSYTGTGTTQVINCGFTGGARFVLIKRTDSTGDWYVWDSARGIVAGNDPYLLLNSTAAEVTGTDFVDTAATGFEITSTAPAAINANGGTFIFLAIA